MRERDFRQLFFADTISQLGSQVSLLALPLTAVLTLDASTFEVGALTACGTVPFLLVGLPAGAWVDRMSRRTVLIASDVGRALVLVTVPVAWLFGALTMPQLYAAALLAGVFTVFFDVAYQSYLPSLVGREQVIAGNSILEGVRGVSQLGGRTAAGLLIQAFAAPLTIGIDAASFAFSALFIGSIDAREERTGQRPRGRLGAEIMEGIRFVLGNALLRAIALSTASFNLFSSMRAALLIVLLARTLQLTGGLIGAFYAVVAAGGLLGALLAARVSRRLGTGRAIWLSTLLLGAFSLTVPLAARGAMLWVAAGGFAASAVANSVYNITQISLRQQLTPEHLLGRLNATMRFLVWGTMPLGGLIGGAAGEVFGVRPALWINAVGLLLPVVPIALSPLPALRSLTGTAGAVPPRS